MNFRFTIKYTLLGEFKKRWGSDNHKPKSLILRLSLLSKSMMLGVRAQVIDYKLSHVTNLRTGTTMSSGGQYRLMLYTI